MSDAAAQHGVSRKSLPAPGRLFAFVLPVVLLQQPRKRPQGWSALLPHCILCRPIPAEIRVIGFGLFKVLRMLTLTRARCLFMAVTLLAAPPLFAQTPTLGEQLKAATGVADPSVVRLRVIGGEQQIDGESVNSLITTGVVISESGEVLTSAFALQGNPDAVFIELANGSRIAAQVVATDEVRRLVLLRVDGGGPWRAIPSAAKSAVQVGQYAIALGRFYAADSVSISVGIVSALNRIHGRALQTDAKVSPVNYGGPLLALSGEALGILVPLSPRGRGTAGSGLEWYDSGIGFAIPMQDALESAAKLRNGTDLRHGLLGLRLEETGAFSAQIVVADVVPGGPAAMAGLQQGDRILKMGERAMERPGMVEEYLLARYAGDAVSVLVQRGAEQKTLTAQLVAELPVLAPGYFGLLPVPQPPSPASGGDEGLVQQMLRRIPGGQAPQNQIAATDDAASPKKTLPLRVLIVPGSPAANSGLPAVIDVLAVNGEQVESETQLRVRLRTSANMTTKIKWKIPNDATEEETEIRSVRRSEQLEQPDEALLKQLETAAAELAAIAQTNAPATARDVVAEEKVDTGGGTAAGSSGIQRQEIEIPEKGRVVVLRSGAAAALPATPVVLLSAHGQPEERILEFWKQAINRYGLLLMIPVNPENALLTDADQSLVMAGLQAVAGKYSCDLRRAVVIAGKEHSSLAFQLIADPSSPLRGASITGGWIDDALIEDAAAPGRTVLFAAPASNALPQEMALRNRSIEQLRKAGFWVPEVGTEQLYPELTAAWTLWLRCL